MKRLVLPAFLAANFCAANLDTAALAAPAAILTRASGNVSVVRGAQKLVAKNGLPLQKGDKVIVTGGSATVFSLGAAPQTIRGGTLVVGVASATRSGSPALWQSVYKGLETGLNRGNRRVAATMRRIPVVVPLAPLNTTLETSVPRFEWQPFKDGERYEVVVRDASGKEVYRAQTGASSLPYPASAPALSGKLSWQVTALASTDGKWSARTGMGPSPLAWFQIPTPAQLAGARRDVAALDALLKNAVPAERFLARAALWHERGFQEAALRELAKIPADPTALELRKTIWIETGQSWRLEDVDGEEDETNPPVGVGLQPIASSIAASTGNANAKYLAFTPTAPLTIEARKTYIAPDRHFALQIPDTFCALNFVTKRGARFWDFAATEQLGARLTFAFGPAKVFAGKDTLLGHTKALIDSINSTPAHKGDSWNLESSAPTLFRGHAARLTIVKSVSKGKTVRGQALEWSEGGEVYLFLFGDSQGDAQVTKALRPLLDTLRLGKAVPPLAPQSALTEKQILDEVEATWKARNMERDEDAQFSSDFQLKESPTSQLPDLEALDKARLATPENSYQRSTAALLAARAAARLGADALAKGNDGAAAALFERSGALETESYQVAIAALQAKVKMADAQIAHWASYTPPQHIASIYNFVLGSWKGIKTLRLDLLHSRQQLRGDTAALIASADSYFEWQKILLNEQRLVNDAPEKLFEQRIEVAKAFDGLGAGAMARADLDGARAYYGRSLIWRRSVPATYPHREVFLTLGYLARLETQLGDLRLAKDFYQQAIADHDSATPAWKELIASTKDDSYRESMEVSWASGLSYFYNNLGSVYKSLGDYTLAETQYKKALQAVEVLPTSGYSGNTRATMRASTLGNLGILSVASGDFVAARRYYEEAAAIYRQSGDQVGLALTLYNDAGLDYSLSLFPAALEKLHNARDLYALMQKPSDIIGCDIFSSQIASYTGDTPRAIETARGALQLARQLKSPRLIGMAGGTLAWALVDSGADTNLTPATREEVSGLLDEVSALDARSGSAEAEITDLYLHARFAVMQQKWDEALATLTTAIARNERIRATSASSTGFSDQQANYEMYELAVKLLLKLNRPEEAFDMISRARSKKLRDTLQLSALSSNDPVLQDLLKRATALDEKLAKTRAQLSEASNAPAPQRDAQKVANLQQLLASTQAEFFEVSAQLKQKNPRFDEVLSLSPSELKKAQKSIPEGALLLQYAPLDDGLYIFAVTKTSLQIFAPKVSREELNKTIRAYRAAIGVDLEHIGKGEPTSSIDDKASPLRLASEQLSAWLVAPVQKEIDAAKIVAIVPSGELFYLPFHALGETAQDGKWRFLIEDKPVAYLAKGDVLSVSQNRDVQNQGKGILALGDPTGAGLPAAKLEVESIARIFPDSRAFTGAGASKALLLEVGSHDKRVLHLAAHGILDSAQPNQSYIQLSPSGNDDGKLRVGEILGIDLNKVDLVTLSACQTALGAGQPDGTEISSLAQSFSTAGTPSVIASLWNVEDKSTEKLMEAFYGALADETAKGQALQKAQITVLRDPATRHPLYWAPFELMGDWR